ncbi:Uncharacterized protein F383_29655 [Gossypium arboreum]|uniref:Uncharacterized protein n=1 Tax=Gossypium arboreum TaxID=29729 RepID=A0A0B0PFT0_GOSAR|nr:Uncharacterized protein F383_29655 [Gossypium arboreum]
MSHFWMFHFWMYHFCSSEKKRVKGYYFLGCFHFFLFLSFSPTCCMCRRMKPLKLHLT